MKIAGKLPRVPNEGGQGRRLFQTLVLVVVDLDATKLLFFGFGGGAGKGKKVKSAYEPSGPLGRSLSRFL